MHRRALVLLPCLIPCLRCENSNSHHFWLCNVTTYTREPTTRAWISANKWRQDGAICSKNRKIVPYHGSARIPRLTASVPDYGSCVWIAIHFFVNFNIFKWMYLAYYWVYLHQTWGFVNSVCTLWLCGSTVANRIIYRLLLSPSRHEIGQ